MIAAPYTARQCPECEVWIYCADGPFAEGDRTKTLADWNHWAAEHLGYEPTDAVAIGFPLFMWNDVPVEVATPRAPDPSETPSLDRWGREILTVGQLRSIMAALDDDVQVVLDDGEGWYVNVSFVGVPFSDDDAMDYSPYSALTLGLGSGFDARQL